MGLWRRVKLHKLGTVTTRPSTQVAKLMRLLRADLPSVERTREPVKRLQTKGEKILRPCPQSRETHLSTRLPTRLWRRGRKSSSAFHFRRHSRCQTLSNLGGRRRQAPGGRPVRCRDRRRLHRGKGRTATWRPHRRGSLAEEEALDGRSPTRDSGGRRRPRTEGGAGSFTHAVRGSRSPNNYLFPLRSRSYRRLTRRGFLHL